MNRDLYSELLAERFGAPIVVERAAGVRFPHHGDGGPDNDITCAQRRRILCEALDDKPSRLDRRAA